MSEESLTTFHIPELYSKALFEALPGSCILLKNNAPHYTILAASPAYITMIGITKDNLIGKGMFEAYPPNPDDPLDTGSNDVRASLEMVRLHKKPHQLPVQRYDVAGSDGLLRERYWSAINKPVLAADGEVAYIIHTAEDITDEVKAGAKEKEHQELVKAYKIIEESNKDFQFVTDFMPQMIWITRPDGYHYYYNKQWYDFTGLTYGDTDGEGWNDVFHPDDQERARKLWRHCLATGEPYEIEYRCRRYDGVYRWVLGRALPLKDENGNILKWFGTCTDIHEQIIEAQALEEKVEERTQELLKANQELQRSNKNLEEFAYAASHDLKEPVRKIHVFSERLKISLGDRMQESEKQYFERMELASKRMSTLIEDLLTYSEVSQKTLTEQEVDLNYIINSVLSDLDLEVEQKGATIKASKLFTIKGHRRQLQQAFQNLIGNALKYSKPDVPPIITITCGKVSGSDTNLQLTPEEQTKEFYQVTVSDNGIGFEQEDADRIFNVFTRLHGMAEYKGSGVGLSIVRKVIENHQGHIWALSKPGEGATFKVLLPVG